MVAWGWLRVGSDSWRCYFMLDIVLFHVELVFFRFHLGFVI